MSAMGQMDEAGVAGPCTGVPAGRERHAALRTLSGERAHTKGHVFYNPIYGKCPEQANPEMEGGLVVARGRENGERLLLGTGPLWGDGSVLEAGSGEGRTF